MKPVSTQSPERPALLPVRIDAKLCRRDGLCAMVCPLSIIGRAEDGLAVAEPAMAGRCIRCGHCVAVCPAGALSLGEADGWENAGPGEPIRKELCVSLEQAEQLLRTRRSVRLFKPEPPDRELLVRLLDDTQWAASGHNARPVAFCVHHGREAVSRVAEETAQWMRLESERSPELAARFHLPGLLRALARGRDLICRSAPCLVVAHAPETGITPREDALTALTYLEIAAHAAGLGACWAGFVTIAAARHEPLLRALGVPEGHAMCGGLMLGRPALRYARIPPRPRAAITWAATRKEV
ncbi:nitroreductase [Desulfovibrio sp. X2]|uniref:nitroreductase family protein n=1 Tax=Desulfovibrio sp. X2 TaxID=941449 RepID=UPI000358C66A|nr:nitroreductase family protein [Desulfovibrio sp. X2]EPR38692.1 nitroreductase [Desulfovibrio sp. X2]